MVHVQLQIIVLVQSDGKEYFVMNVQMDFTLIMEIVFNVRIVIMVVVQMVKMEMELAFALLDIIHPKDHKIFVLLVLMDIFMIQLRIDAFLVI